MLRRNLVGILLILMLAIMLVLTAKMQPAEASGTIYIRADGSVEPETAPISTFDNVSYTFTGDIHGSIVVERDNIVLDGAGYTLQGTENRTGTYLSYRSNVTIKNMEIRFFEYGIRLLYSSNNSILGNNITANNGCGILLEGSLNNDLSGNILADNYDGIRLYESSSNMLRHNDLSGHRYNFAVHGSSLSDYIQDIDDSNTVNGKPIHYWVNKRDMIIPTDAGYVALVNCTCITVQNLNLANNRRGIVLAYTTNSTITENSITANAHGIWLEFSFNNRIFGNSIANNYEGISIGDSSDNIVTGNNITNNWYGVVLEDSSDNSIFGNNVADNGWIGIYLRRSPDSTISGNSIMNNGAWGICLEFCEGLAIYHNNLVDNFFQAFCFESTNLLDNGCEGNYWSDYSGTDSDGDGIGDTPYVIDENNTDRHPLMGVYWNSCDINHDLKVDMKDVGISASAFYTEPGDARWNCHADITGPLPLEPDYKVNMRDVALIARNFGETYP